MKFYKGNIKPEDNVIMVFGSNPEGRHGAGAASIALSRFGAIYGQGEGLQGNSYALPTKDLVAVLKSRWYRPGINEANEIKQWYESHEYSDLLYNPLNKERSMHPNQIINNIKRFYRVATENPNKIFKVVNYRLGELSLNGYLGEEMRQMFLMAGEIPENVYFHESWDI